jgi:hypothetical protein
MAVLMEIDPKVKAQMTEVWSCCEEPPGVYIGSENINGRMFHYYQRGSEFFYENDYSREMRDKEKERRRLKWAWKDRNPSNG